MNHIFPDKITSHKLTLSDGTKFDLLVSKSETYGHALARAGIAQQSVDTILLEDAPLWYEPDHASATR